MRDDPGLGFLRLMGVILILACMLWGVAIWVGFWPYLMVFAVLCFIGLWWYGRSTP